MRNLTNLQKLSRDIICGNVREFASVNEAEDKIREVIKEECGGEWDYYLFQQNRWKVYKVMKEVLDLNVENYIEDVFQEFVDLHNVNLGDKLEFMIEDTSLFKVGVISAGNDNIRRQTLINGKLTVSTEKLGVKIYSEFDHFISGRINWSKMVERVGVSMSNEIASRIYNALIGSVNSLPDERKSALGYTADILRNLIKEVEKDGQEAVVYGTKYALGKVSSGDSSEKMKDRIYSFGYYDQFEGTSMVKIPNGRKSDNSMLIADNFLLICPAGEKILKMVIEGDAEVTEKQGQRADQQLEHIFAKKIGIAALIARNFAIYQIG